MYYVRHCHYMSFSWLIKGGKILRLGFTQAMHGYAGYAHLLFGPTCAQTQVPASISCQDKVPGQTGGSILPQLTSRDN